jgi:hypothetical protein
MSTASFLIGMIGGLILGWASILTLGALLAAGKTDRDNERREYERQVFERLRREFEEGA